MSESEHGPPPASHPLGYETPTSKAPPVARPLHPRRRPMAILLILRRICFAFGMALVVGAWTDAITGNGDVAVTAGLGGGLVGLGIPLGRLPWFCYEDASA